MVIVILDCNIVEFKLLKLIVNCLLLISIESRIRRKKYINFQVQGAFCT